MNEDIDISEIMSKLAEAMNTIARLDLEVKSLQLGSGSFALPFKTGTEVPEPIAPAARAPFSLYYIDGQWKLYYPEGSFTHSGFKPTTVTPAPASDYVPVSWISAGSGVVYAHAMVNVNQTTGEVTGCKSLTFDGNATKAAEAGTKVFSFKVATVTNFVVDQVALGSIHVGGGASSVTLDDKSTKKNSEGKVEVYGWKEQDPEQSTVAGLISDIATNNFEVVVRSGKDGALKYVPLGNATYADGYTGEKLTLQNLAYNYSDHTIVQTVRHDYYAAGKLMDNYNVGGKVYPFTEDIIVTTATPHVGEIP